MDSSYWPWSILIKWYLNVLVSLPTDLRWMLWLFLSGKPVVDYVNWCRAMHLQTGTHVVALILIAFSSEAGFTVSFFKHIWLYGMTFPRGSYEGYPALKAPIGETIRKGGRPVATHLLLSHVCTVNSLEYRVLCFCLSEFPKLVCLWKKTACASWIFIME